MRRFLKWIIKTFYPDLLESGRHWVDTMIVNPRFKIVRALVEHVEETKSEGQHKHVYVLTAMTSEARRNGTPASAKDINFMIELVLQMKKRGL